MTNTQTQIKKTYDVVQDGFLMGQFHAAGTTVDMLPGQARYDLPPFGSMLRDPSEAPAKAARPSAPKNQKSLPESSI